MVQKSNITIRYFALLVAFSLLFMSCTSTTLIKSTPTGATLYVEGIKKGVTPVEHTDASVSLFGSKKQIKLEKEGYKTLNDSISKEKFNVGRLIAALFIGPAILWFPILWLFDYPEQYQFELEPVKP